MRILTGPKLQFCQLLFSPDGRHLAGVGRSQSGCVTAPMWAVQGDGNPVHELPGESSFFPRIDFVAFTAGGRRALVRNEHHRWFAFDLESGEHTLEEQLSGWDVKAISGNGRWAIWHLYPGVEHVEVRIRVAEFEAERWSVVWHRDIADPRDARVRAEDHEFTGFAGFRLSNDGSRLLAHFRTERLGYAAEVMFQVLDTATGTDVSEWRGRLPTSAEPKGISPNGQVLCFNQNSLHVIDTAQTDSAPLSRTNTSQMAFSNATFSPDGRLLATTCGDTTVTFWDTATWHPVQRYGWKIGRLRAVAFAPDGLTCAAGSDTGKVVLFDVDV